jgi:ribosomal protein RSM22 (predicted rRNA methylase)
MQCKICDDAGPGTGVFASKGVFPSLSDFVLVEPSRSMSQVAEHLLYDTSGVMYRRSLAEVHR